MVKVMFGAHVAGVRLGPCGALTVHDSAATSAPGSKDTATVRDGPLPSGAITGAASFNRYAADAVSDPPLWSVTVTVTT